MLRGNSITWAMMSAMAMLWTVGCCDQEKKQIADLQRDNAQMANTNKDVRTELDLCKGREQEARTRADSLASDLANKDAEIAGLRGRMNDANSRTPAGWVMDPFGAKTVVGGDVLFDSGDETLKVGGKARLDAIVRDIKTHYPGMLVRVYGHTDSDKVKVSGWKDNWELSAGRALTVARYLKDHGINASMIEAVAMGEYHPESSDKSKNRRVEIYVVKAKAVVNPR